MEGKMRRGREIKRKCMEGKGKGSQGDNEKERVGQKSIEGKDGKRGRKVTLKERNS